MLTTASAVLAAESEAGKAGPLGLLVMIVLGLEVFLLGRSMVTHLKRVPASFDQPAGDAAGSGVTPAPRGAAADFAAADTADAAEVAEVAEVAVEKNPTGSSGSNSIT